VFKSNLSASCVGIGVTVELCSPDWKTVLAATKTDDAGYFSLEKSPGKLFYLRFSSPEVNPFQVRVRISKHAAHDLKHSSDHRHMTIEEAQGATMRITVFMIAVFWMCCQVH
jgi:hypothetical protein